MSNSVQFTNFTDFDRLLGGKNFLITIIGSAGAFALGYLGLALPVPFIPYVLTFSLFLMILVSVYTANIASSAFVVLVGSLGVTGPQGNVPDFFLGFVVTNLFICVTLGYYANKLRLVMKWTRFYHLFAIFFALISVGMGYLFSSEYDKYSNAGIDLATGGDLGTGLELPVFDAFVVVLVIVLVGISTFMLRGQIQLTTSSSKKYIYFGYLLITIGHLATLLPLLLFSVAINSSEIATIANNDYHLLFLTQIFFYGENYGVLGGLANIFFVMPISITLIAIGINFKTVGTNRGNLEGCRGGSDMAYLASPFAIIYYFVYASSYVQNPISPFGLYISLELFPVFAVGIWALYMVNQIIARLVLSVVDLI